MKKTEVIATKNSSYGGRIKAGDTMKVSAAEGRVLVLLGKARYAPKETKVIPKITQQNVKQTYRPPVQKDISPKRTYQRRDMVAESTQEKID